MVEPRSRVGDGRSKLRIERVDVVPTDLGTLLVRMAGRWEGEPAPGAAPVLAVPAPEGEWRFEPLPETSEAAARAAPGADAFRAAFSVPEELRPALGSGMRLEVAGLDVTLPPPAEMPAAPAAGGTLVDRAVLAERRARRAELAEEANARRAEEAQDALAALEGELANLELRLERAADERAVLERRLADAARDAREAAQRAHAERRRREEAVEESASDAAEAQDATARLRDSARVADERARALSAEAGELRRRLAEAEQTAAAATAARRRAEAAAEREASGAAERAERAQREATAASAEALRQAEERAARAEVAAREAAFASRRREVVRAEGKLVRLASEPRPPAPLEPPELDAALAAGLLAAEARAARSRGAPEGEARALRDEARAAAAAVADAAWTLAEARDAVGGATGAVEDERARRAEAESERDAAVRAVRAAEEGREAEARRAREAGAALERERARSVRVQVRAEQAVEFLRARVAELHGLAARAREDEEAMAAMRELSGAAREALAEAELRIGDAHEAAAEAQARLDRERDEIARQVEAVTERLRADLEGRIAGLEAALAAERTAREQAEAAVVRPAPAPGAATEEPTAPKPAAPAPEPAAEPRPAGGGPERPAPAPRPWLPDALRRLAAADPEAAVRLCVQLLPAQALRGGPVLDYDLDVPDLGWHAVTLREGRGTFARLGEPRGRRRSDFRLSLDAPALAELLASGGSRAVRRAGRARVRGTLRRRRALASLPPAVLDLGELAEARVWPDPGLVLAALAQLIDPEWTGSAPFAVALLVSGPRGGSWAIRSPGGRRPLVVAGRDPGADVTVRLSQDSFQRMLAGQAAGGTGTAIRGDVAALARLVEWVERARRGTS